MMKFTYKTEGVEGRGGGVLDILELSWQKAGLCEGKGFFACDVHNKRVADVS